MSKATERMDITVSAGMLTVLGMVFAGSLFASASPAIAPSVAQTNISSAVHEYSASNIAADSGGRLKK
jgi:hypothetical protein